ncbi:hypothetical protein GCM10010238_66180 [Streptomyces griseoviridis]|uniref:Uncharacterized protein n=1 Tax=Streptomyces griseoviridis TaxID=45398 RepID=A0A918GVI9_STRGD|nr:hypothetical protein GCM10010238_66180 [Streptomyces niveoruber]
MEFRQYFPVHTSDDDRVLCTARTTAAAGTRDPLEANAQNVAD